jgi:hypothetical protein
VLAAGYVRRPFYELLAMDSGSAREVAGDHDPVAARRHGRADLEGTERSTAIMTTLLTPHQRPGARWRGLQREERHCSLAGRRSEARWCSCAGDVRAWLLEAVLMWAFLPEEVELSMLEAIGAFGSEVLAPAHGEVARVDREGVGRQLLRLVFGADDGGGELPGVVAALVSDPDNEDAREDLVHWAFGAFSGPPTGTCRRWWS